MRGIRIKISDAVIAEVSGLPTEGTIRPKKHIMLQDAVDIFRDASEELTKKGKGIRSSSLAEPCHELASVV